MGFSGIRMTAGELAATLRIWKVPHDLCAPELRLREGREGQLGIATPQSARLAMTECMTVPILAARASEVEEGRVLYLWIKRNAEAPEVE